jgi:hypothetical protein
MSIVSIHLSMQKKMPVNIDRQKGAGIEVTICQRVDDLSQF